MIGDKFATYNEYTSEASSSLYPTAGDTTDWTYGELGVPAFTFELGNSFMPSYSEIDSTQWPKNKPALIYAAKIARAPYELVEGPDVTDIIIVQGTGNSVKITAQINDLNNGGNIIASAELYIGNPDWVSNSVAFQMLPVDGDFDSSFENVSINISIDKFISNPKMIFVRGADTEGNYGPATADFVGSIPEPLFLFPCCLIFYLLVLIK
jgi:hypothetical protein